MIEEIKKRLEAGEVVELECINGYGFINNNRGRVRDKEEILSSSLMVHSVDDGRDVVLLSSYSLRESDLEYFRIKRPTTTFDDLVDVVVKAYKNRLLDIFLMNDEVITVFNHDARGTKEGINKADTRKYYQFIDFINSLYTETFVIESEDDMSKIKKGDLITMVNGESITAMYGDNTHSVSFVTDIMRLMPFIALKGATVTQKRGK